MSFLEKFVATPSIILTQISVSCISILWTYTSPSSDRRFSLCMLTITRWRFTTKNLNKTNFLQIFIYQWSLKLMSTTYVCLPLILLLFHLTTANPCLAMTIYCVSCCNLLCPTCRKFVEKTHDENYLTHCMELYSITEKRACRKYGEVMRKESTEKLIS